MPEAASRSKTPRPAAAPKAVRLYDARPEDAHIVQALRQVLRHDFASGVEGWLLQRYAMRRPPLVSARLLALICDLHAAQQPFPQRAHVAAALDASIFGIDVALNTALTREDVTLDVRLSPGNIAGRDSVLRRRFYAPGPELAALARAYAPRKRA